MAFNARLHANRTDLLSKMLLGITDDLLRHVIRQRVVRFVVDGDARHSQAPLPLWAAAVAVCGHRPTYAPSCDLKICMPTSCGAKHYPRRQAKGASLLAHALRDTWEAVTEAG